MRDENARRIDLSSKDTSLKMWVKISRKTQNKMICRSSEILRVWSRWKARSVGRGFFDVNTRGSKHWGEDCLQTPSTFNMMSQCALIGDLMSYRLSKDRFNRNNTKVNQRNHVFSASFPLATFGALPGHLTIPRFPGVEELPIWMWFGFWQIESIKDAQLIITNSGHPMLLRHS